MTKNLKELMVHPSAETLRNAEILEKDLGQILGLFPEERHEFVMQNLADEAENRADMSGDKCRAIVLRKGGKVVSAGNRAYREAKILRHHAPDHKTVTANGVEISHWKGELSSIFPGDGLTIYARNEDMGEVETEDELPEITPEGFLEAILCCFQEAAAGAFGPDLEDDVAVRFNTKLGEYVIDQEKPEGIWSAKSGRFNPFTIKEARIVGSRSTYATSTWCVAYGKVNEQEVKLFEFDDGELHFTANELNGLTPQEARDLHTKRDIAFLQR